MRTRALMDYWQIDELLLGNNILKDNVYNQTVNKRYHDYTQYNQPDKKKYLKMNCRRLLRSQVLSIHRRVCEGERLNTLSSVL